MSEEHTPTTEDVFRAWERDRRDWIGQEFIRPQFDRWLADHDADVRREERKRIAGAIWKEERKALKVLYANLHKIGTPAHSDIESRVVGLMRARDIVEAPRKTARWRNCGEGDHG